MPKSTLSFDEGAWPDLKEKLDSKAHDVQILMGEDSPELKLIVLDKGMTSGKPSVTIRLDLPEGKILIFETSARVFCSAGNAIQARYPDLFVDNDNARQDSNKNTKH